MEKGADAQTLSAKFFENCGSFWIIEDYCQTPVPSPDFSLGLGVDFVLSLSQEEQQQEEQEE